MLLIELNTVYYSNKLCEKAWREYHTVEVVFKSKLCASDNNICIVIIKYNLHSSMTVLSITKS